MADVLRNKKGYAFLSRSFNTSVHPVVFICESTTFTVVVLLSVGCEIKVVCVCFNVQRMPYLARKHKPALHREECIPGSHKHRGVFIQCHLPARTGYKIFITQGHHNTVLGERGRKVEKQISNAGPNMRVGKAVQIAVWYDARKKTTIDVVYSGHADVRATDDNRSIGGSGTATRAYLTRFFGNLPTSIRQAIIGWRGFPGQPYDLRSLYIRDLANDFCIPVVFKRDANKVVIPTVIAREANQPTVPCGGQKRMSLVIDFDEGQFSTKLRIGKYFVADTSANRGTQWTVEYTP